MKKPIIWLSIAFVILVVLDELAYKAWRVDNPGHHWSHLDGTEPYPLSPEETVNSYLDDPRYGNDPRRGIRYYAPGRFR